MSTVAVPDSMPAIAPYYMVSGLRHDTKAPY